MIKDLLRTVLPGGLASRLCSSPMKIGVGRDLRFDPGPSNHAYASGDNELPVQSAIADSLKTGDVFYDVGANVGFFTVIGARLVGPAGAVLAFEPVHSNADYVRRNIELNGFSNVEVIEKAVTSKSGTGELALAAYSGGAALTSAAAPPDATAVISVDLVSIDDLVFNLGFRPPSVIKIDVEGAEVDVMKGMVRTLTEIRPSIVYEIDDGVLANFQDKWWRCENFLNQFSYRIQQLPNSYPNTHWIVGHAIATPS